jgi:RHS repeat-associated protein
MGTAPGNEQRGAPGNGRGSDKTPTKPDTGNGNSGNVNGNNGQAKEHSNNGLHLGQLKNGKENPGQGRERRSDTANAHAQDVVKNPTLTGTHPGQGNDKRSDKAISLAQSPTPQLVVTEGEASVELGGDTSGGEGVTGTETYAAPTVNGQSEFIWYYHPDHLGSTGFVTDQNGELYEHVEYFPFGETWVQEHSNTQRTPYLYTGKELDEETGLYYFGARYYDPRTSVWQSADPIVATYLGGQPNGGILNSRNLNLYSYNHLNPVGLVDPDGKAPINSKDWNQSMRFFNGSIGAPTCTSIRCNSQVYDGMDTSLATGYNSGAIKSDWFAAASHVTSGNGGLGGLDFVPDFMSDTASYLTSVHHSLAKENYKTFNALVSGSEVPGLQGLRGKDLDYALVNKEQALVTKFTNEYFGSNKDAKGKAFSQINQIFDPQSTLFGNNSNAVQNVIKNSFQQKGIKFDIGNEAHRRELGYGLIDYIHQERNRGD